MICKSVSDWFVLLCFKDTEGGAAGHPGPTVLSHVAGVCGAAGGTAIGQSEGVMETIVKDWELKSSCVTQTTVQVCVCKCVCFHMYVRC